MSGTAIMKSELFLEHDPGFSHVESPDRLISIYNGLAEYAELDCFVFPEFGAAEKRHLELVHTPEHVRRIAETAGQGFVSGNPVEQAYRDAKYFGLAGTTSEVARMAIADEMLARNPI